MPIYAESFFFKRTKGRKSLQEFANYMNENISKGMPGAISRMAVWYWINDIHPVTGERLMAWKQYYPPGDPRHEMAKDILNQREKIGGASITDKKLMRSFDRE